MLSIFDIFKISLGPSSSHTMGPMIAAKRFIVACEAEAPLTSITSIRVDLYGSLALTGRGHLTDVAILLGLAKNDPDTVDVDGIDDFINAVKTNERLSIPNQPEPHTIDFPTTAISFHDTALPLHENGMTFSAFNGKALILEQTYYSIGGGFVVEASEFNQKDGSGARHVKYPCCSAADMLAHCKEEGLNISDIMLENEQADKTKSEIIESTNQLWTVMQDAVTRGCHASGPLPGKLKLNRRAPHLHQFLSNMQRPKTNDPLCALNWVHMFALACSETNASGGRVVTAPTNGATGIIPAVLHYYDTFVEPLTPEKCLRFYLTSGFIGILYKTNASISGAEVGCQGEVGVACSMAAAGLAELMGATPPVVCCAAVIAMEHHLGLTCDPIAGLVQVPCIERNAVASVTAINSAMLAMERDSPEKINLDEIIATMYQTGKDINAKYRETSLGGLALLNTENREE